MIKCLIFREAVEAAKAVINKLKLKSFVPVEDTSLQSVYKTIEAHALNKETMQPVSKIIVEIILNFSRCFDPYLALYLPFLCKLIAYIFLIF